MRIDLLTLFPEFFRSPLSESMLQRAQDLGAVEFRVINLRDYTTDRHHVVDDRPFGGGPGMVMKIDPLAAAIRVARLEDPEIKIFLLSPQGPVFSQEKAGELAGLKHLMLICGHYEGVDDRIKYYIDGMLSIGDYILTGGEIPALAVVDAVTRLLPGVLGGEGSADEESFQTGLLEYPHYTRPREFDGHEVPQVLLEGNHRVIEAWRRQQSLRRTWRRRPDLLAKADLPPEDKKFIESLAARPEEDR
ncbi:MAG: tRNA (guanosine(37)-N1)-methyltransferase TrmD [Deltaproteobacteria bacterium]|nr:tRNA (guanosine(37)-N1)-methyltransferase TrmD [Deltaproteobacteria bacterium]